MIKSERKKKDRAQSKMLAIENDVKNELDISSEYASETHVF